MPRNADDLQQTSDSIEPGSPAHRSGRTSSTSGALSRKLDSPRGLLDPAAAKTRFHLSRYHASEELDFFIEHYWVVVWNLRGQENHWHESLPHPSVCIAVEQGRSEVVGVVEGRFARTLEGNGRVFGIKFRPGGFYPFYERSVSELTNHVVPLSDVFGDAGKTFGSVVSAEATDERNVAMAEELLLARHPDRDQHTALVRRIVEQIAATPDLTKVDDLVMGLDVSKRQLQRLFSRYVGVSPKWVILRYRLHEAIERIERGQPVNWTRLAIDLGYFDQSHFIKHFKAFVGRSPDEYSRSLGTATHD